MLFKIQIFAGLADYIGSPIVTINTQEETMTITELKRRLTTCYPGAEELLKQAFIAKNQAYAGFEDIVRASDEIAVIPPVSGG